MKKNLSTFFAFFCFVILVLFLGVSAVDSVSSSTIYGKVLRLHVLANSDSKEDIEMKYRVRDALLDVTGRLFLDCENVEDALERANENKRLLCDVARGVLDDGGCAKDVNVVIGKEDYPEKTYSTLTFPEGEYLSVRVIIGNGDGKNWWCVLFPPLCNAGITDDDGRLLVSYGIDENEVKKLEEQERKNSFEIFGCRVKLKILDYLK